LSDIVIKAEGLGKKYIISHEAPEKYTALRDVINSKAKGLFNKAKKTAREEFWALKDISFEVKRGEAIGIIGRNGAGKSTLLKILSRITEPTEGRIEISGRTSSLLEVGTGFHPELTGRENIFLNGAILGMSRTEIKKKFDAIVDFSGVEKFLDTPVKRYSSGMYLRLAFAVAAHLEPEILMVDEVLAVGDAEFQKKCLGKMDEVSKKEGRTVLFVSHNISAVKSLCQKGILLDKGRITGLGSMEEVALNYIHVAGTEKLKTWSLTNAPGNEKARLLEVEVSSEEGNFFIDKQLDIRFKARLETPTDKPLNFSMVLLSNEDIPVFNVGSQLLKVKGPLIEAVCHLPAGLLNDEFYRVRILLVENSSIALFDLDDIISFKMEERNRDTSWYGKWIGLVRPQELVRWTDSSQTFSEPLC
jgi:lipopolysaccharide transport system ATP-binding protein